MGALAATVRAFREHGGKGLYVALPLKHEAYDRATRCSERAEQAGAVNTLSFNGGEIAGDKTDGAGLLRDNTHNRRFEVRGKRVLLLGAGGVVWLGEAVAGWRDTVAYRAYPCANGCCCSRYR